MKYLRNLLLALGAVPLQFFMHLNTKSGSIPPLGKFSNP